MKPKKKSLKKPRRKRRSKGKNKQTRAWYSMSKPMMWLACISICVLPLLWLGTNTYQPIINTSIQALLEPASGKVMSKDTQKHLEMLNVIVHVAEIQRSGSGVLMYKGETEEEDVCEYFVITNYHIVMDREIPILKSVDGLRGIIDFELEDLGCQVTVFSNNANIWTTYDADIVSESPDDDLAVVRFVTADDIESIAKIATDAIMADVNIFDEVYAVGCQLSRRPIPTVGIISGVYNAEGFVGFSHTAQISPGSSGGGLFKKCDDHFYLIGIPSMVAGYGIQIIPHYGYAISTTVLREFLGANDMDFILGETCKEKSKDEEDVEHETIEEI